MEERQRQSGYDWLKAHDPEALDVLVELNSGCPELVDKLVKDLYEDLYQRSGLDLKTRLLITIACAASAGSMIPQVTYQSRLALLNGVSLQEIHEVLFHVAVFSGFSHAMNAMNATKVAISTIRQPKG